MNILATSYTLKHSSLDIYVSGCNGNPHCEGCHNPESWDFNQGRLFDRLYFSEIKTKIIDFDNMIDNIMIFGGEPMDQNYYDLVVFLDVISTLNKKIWLFTGYNISEIPRDIKKYCNYIKTGKYIPELVTDDNVQYGIKLATSNQYIYKIKH